MPATNASGSASHRERVARCLPRILLRAIRATERFFAIATGDLVVRRLSRGGKHAISKAIIIDRAIAQCDRLLLQKEVRDCPRHAPLIA